VDGEGRAWLQEATTRQRRVMADRRCQLKRATKEADNDYTAFGQSPLSLEMNPDADGLLYRCHHLRDCAWGEDSAGNVGEFNMKWKPTAAELVRLFPKTVHSEVRRIAKTDPTREIECRRTQMPTRDYEEGFNADAYPWTICTIDVENEVMLEEVAQVNRRYLVPRWQTVSGSPYAFSPATVAALPDARLIQAITLTLLEAGEMAVNPPLIGTHGAIRDDVQLFSSGITWVDADYDEKMGEALRPLSRDKSGLPFGMEAKAEIAGAIQTAFYLDKLTPIPNVDRDMTAFEISQHMQKYVREALPLFEPIEDEYNGPLCEETFTLLMPTGVFGRPSDMPKSLQGQDIQFRFESPLHDARERDSVRSFMEAAELLAVAAGLDPRAPEMVDARVALRQALVDIKTPENWIRSDEEMAEADQVAAMQAEAEALTQGIERGAAAAKDLGAAMSGASA